ncbi:MAG: hypothetical protein U0165_18130, partial [Polyangiaceae bacterium]
RLFEPFDGVRAAIPGTHDIWMHGWNAESSWEIHEQRLPELFAAQGFHPLHIEPLRIGDVGVVGSMGWYDYSFRDDIGIALDVYATKAFPGTPRAVWGDRIYARFPFDDVELTHRLTDRLSAHLRDVGAASQVIGVVHHLVHRDLRPLHHFRSVMPIQWRFLNTFLGSDCLGEPLLAHPAVTQVFCGHVHRAKTLERAGKRLTSIGGDYRKKQLIEANEHRTISRRLFRAPVS